MYGVRTVFRALFHQSRLCFIDGHFTEAVLSKVPHQGLLFKFCSSAKQNRVCHLIVGWSGSRNISLRTKTTTQFQPTLYFFIFLAPHVFLAISHCDVALVLLGRNCTCRHACNGEKLQVHDSNCLQFSCPCFLDSAFHS